VLINMAISGGPFPPIILYAAITIAIIGGVAQGLLSYRKKRVASIASKGPTQAAKEHRSEQPFNAQSPKAWTFPRIAGIFSGLVLMVADVLYFSFVVPARTEPLISFTILLFIIGLSLSVLTFISGLYQIDKSKRQKSLT